MCHFCLKDITVKWRWENVCFSAVAVHHSKKVFKDRLNSVEQRVKQREILHLGEWRGEITEKEK